MSNEARTGEGIPTAFPRGLLDVPGAAFLDAAFGTSLLSADSVILDVNEEFCRMLGYDAHELVGRHLLEIVHPDDHGVINRIHGAMRRGEIDSDQTRRLYVRKDGDVMYAMAGVTAVRDGDGSLIGIVKQIQDITRRVRAERELQESLARQRVMVDTLADGVVVLDADGRARLANPSAEEVVGVAARELSAADGRSRVRLRDEEGGELEQGFGVFRDVIASGRPRRGVILQVERPDGALRWVRANARPLVRPGGEEPYVVVSFSDVTALKLREQELVHHALHDALTDLPNRRYFLEHLERAVIRDPRPRLEGDAVLYVDLDGFKRVNDRYGHGTGDTVLVEVGRRMMQTVRPGDVVARLAGDEFGLLLSRVGGAQRAVEVAREVISTIAGPFVIDGLAVQIGASVGLTLVDPSDEDPKDILNRADASLRRAKEAGKGRLVEFSPEVDQAARRQVQLERDLPFARGRGELSLEYAPIVPLTGGPAVGETARLAWHHPHLGRVEPEHVQRLLRETGLAAGLDTWVLREALSRMAQLPAAGRYAQVAVPMAGELLVSDGPERLRSQLDASGVEPGRLVLAVHAADDAEREELVAAVKEIATLGVGLMLAASGETRTRSRTAAEFPYQWLGVHPVVIARSLVDQPGRALVRGVLESLRQSGVKTLAEVDAVGPYDAGELSGLGFDFVLGRPSEVPVEPGREERSPVPA